MKLGKSQHLLEGRQMEPQSSRTRPIDAMTIGLLIFAVGSVGVPSLETARRLSLRERCQNNLAALGTSALAFHEANRAFPAGITVAPSAMWPNAFRPTSLFVAASGRCDHPDDAMASAFTQLLP